MAKLYTKIQGELSCLDSYGLCYIALAIGDCEVNRTALAITAHYYNCLATEELHLWLLERLKGCCVSIAGCLKRPGSAHFEGEIIGESGAEGALGIGHAYLDESHIIFVGIDGVAVGRERHCSRFASGGYGLLTYYTAV